MNLFVEIAIPTTIVLTTEKSKVSTLEDTKYNAQIFWRDDREKFEEKYEYSLTKLYESWPDNILYIHPIKLSQWSE